MTTTTGVNPTSPNPTSSTKSGVGKYIVALLILVAVFFTTRALTTDSSVVPVMSDVPAAVQPDTNVPQ